MGRQVLEVRPSALLQHCGHHRFLLYHYCFEIAFAATEPAVVEPAEPAAVTERSVAGFEFVAGVASAVVIEDRHQMMKKKKARKMTKRKRRWQQWRLWPQVKLAEDAMNAVGNSSVQ